VGGTIFCNTPARGEEETRTDHTEASRLRYQETAALTCQDQECANFHKRTKRIIKLITVQEILDEQHVQRM